VIVKQVSEITYLDFENQAGPSATFSENMTTVYKINNQKYVTFLTLDLVSTLINHN